MAEALPVLICDICKDTKTYIDAVVLCEICRELYCTNCASMHIALRATKDHILIKLTTGDVYNDKGSVGAHCETCKLTGKGTHTAKFICVECRELYCIACSKHHATLKATKHHYLHQIDKLDEKQNEQSRKQKKAGILLSTDSISLSSDFEGFSISPEKEEFVGAQAPVVQPKISAQNRNNPSGHNKRSCGNKTLNKQEMENVFVKVNSTFNGQISSDTEECYFVGIVSLSDSRIILLDRNNRNIKMFDGSFKLLHVEKTKLKSWGMTKVTEDSIAVIFGRSVLFYLIKDTVLIRDGTEFILDENGYGISFNGSLYAIICAASFGSASGYITLRLPDGAEIKRIEHLRNEPNRFIHIDSDENKMFLSTVPTNRVWSISCEGQLETDLRIPIPRDIIKFYNYLLIASMEQTVILCPKNKSYSKITSDDKLRAEHLAYNPEKQSLYSTENSNEIKVFKVTF